MENYIITFVLVTILILGVLYTIKHFKREGGCCGSTGYKQKPKKLKNIISQKTFKVAGMSCIHCKNRVEEVINDIEGISGKVNLKKETLTVSYSIKVDDEIIISAIEKAGYKII